MRRPLLLLALFVGLPACSAAATMATRNLGALTSTPRAVPNKITQPVREGARLAVLWVGHATVLLQLDDKLVLTDPVFTSTVGQMSKRLWEPGILPENVPTVDAVLISHMHFDHLSFGSLEMLDRDRKIRHLFVPRGGLVYVPNLGFESDELGTWESWEKDGLRITAVPVQHVGWRYGADTTWMDHTFTGYVIEYHGLTVYFGGDTAYVAKNFFLTAATFPHIDLALIPIAPIHPRDFMKHTHLDPGEAVQAFLDLKAKRMVPIHFDTFVNSADEPGEPQRVLGEVMRARNLTDADITVLGVGEQRVFIAK